MALWFRNHGILGINARNLKYVRPYNPRKAVAFADNKLKTKLFLAARGIPVPKLYAKISTRDDLLNFDFDQLPDSCVVKPNYGFGGEGILVLTERSKKKGGFVTISGEFYSYQALIEHIEDILDGMYSLNHRRDIAFFEQIIMAHSCFDTLSPVGLPDIRIIAHNLVPVMAEIRVPTAESGGKANLHMGGVGLGVDIAKGSSTFGVQYDKLIVTLPNGRAASGFRIPYWEDMLLHTSRIQQITNIGFIGADFTIDEEHGPVLLEVNARPGLAIQIANMAPLGKRLERIQGLKVVSPEKGVRIAQDLFGEKVVARQEGGTVTKPVLATREPIEVLGKKKTVTLSALLQPDEDRSSFDPSLLEELKDIDAVEETEEGNYRVKFLLGGKKIQTVVRANTVDDEGLVRLGRRDLTGFLVDPSKEPAVSAPMHFSASVERIDKLLADIDRKLHLLKHIRPDNLEIERARAERDASYNPHFVYDDLSFDATDLLDRLQYLEADDSPVGSLLERKRQELMVKIQLLQSRSHNDAFTKKSQELYGHPTPSLVRDARFALRSWDALRSDATDEGIVAESGSLLSSEQVQERFHEVLRDYGLHDWRVVLKQRAVADCSIGRHVIIVREGAQFSEDRVHGLIAHEIETHVLTSENGSKQPYELFERACAGYLDTQEGLAVYRESAVLPPNHEKQFWPAMGVLAIQYGLTHSFAELRAYIQRLGFDDARALRTCFTVKRGMGDTSQSGAFTKGLVYFRGAKLIEKFVESGGDVRALYLGKVNIEDLALLQEIKELVEPVYIPKDMVSDAS